MRLPRVLFVCIGNACRSQMAEAFANHYGGDVMVAKSAGLAPCDMVSPVTAALMRERGIALNGAHPKGLDEAGANFDLIVNLSGLPLPRASPPRCSSGPSRTPSGSAKTATARCATASSGWS